nr:patatin-like phospholipase family protein [Acholeplasma laidlawii]
MNQKIKVGLMLGGGGAKGTYQLGVIKALEELNLLKHIDAISGVSIGAINTLLLMSKKSIKKWSRFGISWTQKMSLVQNNLS